MFMLNMILGSVFPVQRKPKSSTADASQQLIQQGVLDVPPVPREATEEETLRLFIQEKVLAVFNHHKQFGVLVLTGESGLLNIGRTTLLPHYYQQYHNNLVIYPSHRGDYDNFILVRPQRHGLHAEVILLKELMDYLWNSYCARHTSPGHIVLYTGLSPCPTCTEEIIALTQQTIPGISITVGYTHDWRNYKDWGRRWPEVNRKCRERLYRAGIGILHVPEFKEEFCACR